MKKLLSFPYKRALVLGLAKSGTAAAQLLIESGIDVVINDFKSTAEDKGVADLIRQGGKVVLGSHPLSVLDQVEIVIKNPGISYDNIIIREAQNRKIPIITEIELAANLVDGPIIGITGSNGKTTTTTLLGDMFLEDKIPVKIAGNIGTVACEVAQSMQSDETMVLELSSFQLLGIQEFKPNIAVLLNIFEAHLDYHTTMENYVQAKAAIFRNQTHGDYLVYNADDQCVAETVQKANATLIPFSKCKKTDKGTWIDHKSIYFQDEKIIDIEDIVLVGAHNLENVLAAICVAKLSGIKNKAINHVLKTFTGVKHRLQFVKNLEGRLFYNDSKATNILATEKALTSFDKPTILLAGGLDRGNEFDELIPFLNHVKALVVFGETAEKLLRIGKTARINEILVVDNMEEAVNKAYGLSVAGDVILLSPACASWDQYETFEERGDMFIESVHKLA